MMSPPKLRLRQICIAVDALEPALDEFIATMGLKVAHGKGDLTRYGLPPYTPPHFQAAFFETHGIRSALLPVGDTFIELIAPTRADSGIARYLDKRGPGGYMIVVETSDIDAVRADIAATGTRIVGMADYPTYQEIQLDPRDTGGSMLSFAMQKEGGPYSGAWFPAGSEWKDDVVEPWAKIGSAQIGSRDGQGTTARWARLLGRERGQVGSATVLQLDEGTIEIRGGDTADRLKAIGVDGTGFADALARATVRTSDGQAFVLCGLEFRRLTPVDIVRGDAQSER